MPYYPNAYIAYLKEFHHTRDYFECHELLEEYWKEHPDSPHRTTWVGLIQVAVGSYHHRRGNILGAIKMLSSAVKQLRAEDLTLLGIDAERFMMLLDSRIVQLRQQPDQPFIDLNIPVQDEQLRPYAKPIPGYAPDAYLIDKHTLRDRSDVIAARAEQLALRHSAKS